jgi:hypothetical protein
LLCEVSRKWRHAAPFDIQQRANQHTDPDLLFRVLIQMRGEQIAMPFELVTPPGNPLRAMKPVNTSDALRIRLFDLRGISQQNKRAGKPLG